MESDYSCDIALVLNTQSQGNSGLIVISCAFDEFRRILWPLLPIHPGQPLPQVSPIAIDQRIKGAGILTSQFAQPCKCINSEFLQFCFSLLLFLSGQFGEMETQCFAQDSAQVPGAER